MHLSRCGNIASHTMHFQAADASVKLRRILFTDHSKSWVIHAPSARPLMAFGAILPRQASGSGRHPAGRVPDVHGAEAHPELPVEHGI
jgi:hypothetical protein